MSCFSPPSVIYSGPMSPHFGLRSWLRPRGSRARAPEAHHYRYICQDIVHKRIGTSKLETDSAAERGHRAQLRQRTAASESQYRGKRAVWSGEIEAALSKLHTAKWPCYVNGIVESWPLVMVK